MAKKITKTKVPSAGESQARQIYPYILWALVGGAWLLLAIALASYNAADWPGHSVAPHNANTSNWAGPVGAYLAHQVYLMIGPGVWIILAGWLALMIAIARKSTVTEPALRIIGVLLMALTASAIIAATVPHLTSRPEGAGGLVAIFLTTELINRFSTLGTLLILAVAFWIGAILAMDQLVITASRYLGSACLQLTQIRPGRLFHPAPVPGSPGTLAPGIHAPGISGQAAADPDSKSNPAQARAFTGILADAEVPPGAVGTALAEGEDATPEVAAQVDESRSAVDLESDPEAPVHDAPGAYLAEKASGSNLDPEALRKKIKALPINFAPKSKTEPPPKPREIDLSGYRFPGLDLLVEPESNFTQEMERYVRDQAVQLEQALRQYRIDGEVVGIDSGPVITLFEVRLAAGTKVSTISAIASDLARALRSHNIRIVPNTVGKDTVGIEVPNAKKERVRLKELMTANPDSVGRMKLPMYLGKDASGASLIADLAEMPHMLIAGTTGSGKSVCMNSIIMSFLFAKRPDELKLCLVDPKMVELSMFKDIPHLMCPVVTEMSKAAAILEWATTKMDERYELLAEAQVRDIAGYNNLTWEELKDRFRPASEAEEARIPKKMPYMVFVVDELADLMITNKEVEGFIVRLAQKARAVGLHLILATQRPQANVVTGLIKGNMPCRVSFKVASGLDSRIVLDQKGAELLLGQGDMLYLSPRSSKLTRAQGTLIDDGEIRRVVSFLRDIAQQNFEPQLLQIKQTDVSGGGDEASVDERDPLFDDAVRIVLETKRGSVSLLQRRLTIGYARASRLIEQMAAAGLLGEYKGSQAREVTITLEEWEAIKAQAQADAEAAQVQGTVFEKSDDQDDDSVPDELPGEHKR